jgi:uncharacterized protein (TIGR02598 family)
MNTPPLQRLGRAHAGFNLIEVVIAVAVCAIGLLAVIGLLPHALESARNMADRTVAATMVEQIVAEYRAGGFDNIPLPGDPPVSRVFAQDGFTTNDINPPYFRVDVTTADGVNSSVRVVTARVGWPVRPPPHETDPPLNSNIFITQIARYEP